jgi:hypothetical protein
LHTLIGDGRSQYDGETRAPRFAYGRGFEGISLFRVLEGAETARDLQICGLRWRRWAVGLAAGINTEGAEASLMVHSLVQTAQTKF